MCIWLHPVRMEPNVSPSALLKYYRDMFSQRVAGDTLPADWVTRSFLASYTEEVRFESMPDIRCLG